MKIVVISPESADSREIPAMGGFFSAGLELYHVRKPRWARMALQAWLTRLPEAWRPHLVLHQHHDLAAALGLGGTHDRDEPGNAGTPGTNRSCHDLASLRRYMPTYKSLFFGPVFPSLSKPGHAPAPDFPWNELKSTLKGRTEADARVLAIGGVTADRLPRCLELGFDGAAVLGAVWNEMDPVGAYRGIRDTATRLGNARNAA